MSTSIGIDLDAAIRESAFPDGIPVTFRGQQFTLPAELPLDVFDPLLDERVDLVGLLRIAFGEGGNEAVGDAIITALFNRPNLPLVLRDAIYDSLRLLFGQEQFDAFQAHRPGLSTYGRLISGLFQKYGVSLGEAFASPASSETGGATSSPTSPATTPVSTPEEPSVAPEPAPASLESVASATS